jgi:hypothetical protein
MARQRARRRMGRRVAVAGGGARWPVEEPDGRRDEWQGGGHGGRRAEGFWWRVVEGSGDLRWRAVAAVVEGGGGGRRRRLLFK